MKISNLSRKPELERVLEEVREQMQYTVISYPERDPKGFTWGKANYNGNCSGKVPLGFIDKLGAKSVAELFAGSGTLSDVCEDYGIPYVGIDLNPNPVRNNIYSMDITDINQDLPEGFYEADMCFSHPPYPGLNHVKYAGKMWEDKDGSLSKRDIQNMSFEKGMRLVNQSSMRAYAALPKGSYLVVLVGEIRANGRYYSMMQNLWIPGEHFQTYVKLQHNTWSDRKGGYGSSPRALTGHEMILVVKKPSGYEITCIVPKSNLFDIRDSLNNATWQDVVNAVLENLGGEAELSQIYEEIEGHKKCESNPHWKEKVRQTLQKGRFEGNGKGYWRIAA